MKHDPTEAASQVAAIDDDGLQRLRELREAAVPAPWGIGEPGGPQGPFPMIWNIEKGYIVAPQVEGRATAEAMVALHNAFPAMCARIEADGRRARHKDDVVVYRLDGGREPIWCVHCSRQAYYVVDSATGSLLTCGQHLLSAVRRKLA